MTCWTVHDWIRPESRTWILAWELHCYCSWGKPCIAESHIEMERLFPLLTVPTFVNFGDTPAY